MAFISAVIEAVDLAMRASINAVTFCGIIVVLDGLSIGMIGLPLSPPATCHALPVFLLSCVELTSSTLGFRVWKL